MLLNNKGASVAVNAAMSMIAEFTAGEITPIRRPIADAAMMVDDTVTLPIQVNGKRRGEINVAKDMPKDEIEALALAEEGVVRAMDGATPKKIIVVPGRIVNVVV